MLQTGLFYIMFGEPVDMSGKKLAFWIGFTLISLIASYLLGSLNSAIIISKLLYHDDIREHGSKNAGMTNMMRTYGKKAALFTLIGDILKVVISITVTGLFLGFYYQKGICWNHYCYLSGLLCMIGHIKPIFYSFKGGKGVLCTAATVAILCPTVFLLLIALFVALVAMTKYISLGSIICAAFLPIALQGYMNVMLNGEPHPLILIISIILSLIVIISHRTNIKRLINGEENKFHFHKD